jgi:hypothetical protein
VPTTLPSAGFRISIVPAVIRTSFSSPAGYPGAGTSTRRLTTPAPGIPLR